MTREEQRYVKELNKQLNPTMKQVAKDCGFQLSHGYAYRFVGEFVYVVLPSVPPVDLGHSLSLWLGMKPLALDDLFWEIFEIREAVTQPKSFHVWGAFTAPFAWFEKWKTPIDSLDTVTASCRTALEQAAQKIDAQCHRVSSVSDFAAFIQTHPREYLNRILCAINARQYTAALDMLDAAIAAHQSGGFADTGGKDILQYARDYCLRLQKE